MSNRDGGLSGEYSEPSEEIGFKAFAAGLTAKAKAYVEINGPFDEPAQGTLL